MLCTEPFRLICKSSSTVKTLRCFSRNYSWSIHKYSTSLTTSQSWQKNHHASIHLAPAVTLISCSIRYTRYKRNFHTNSTFRFMVREIGFVLWTRWKINTERTMLALNVWIMRTRSVRHFNPSMVVCYFKPRRQSKQKKKLVLIEFFRNRRKSVHCDVK